jgi:hypothetical protein
MKLTKSKLKEIILQELSVDESAALYEMIDAEIEKMVRKRLEEGPGWGDPIPSPERINWRDDPTAKKAVENAVNSMWTNYSGDVSPERPLRAAQERAEQWQAIFEKLKLKAKEATKI